MEVPDSKSALSLSSLPSEIKLQIALNLSQIDALNLSRTGKIMSDACLQRIYETVVVDAFYTQFSKEYFSGFTYINSSYNLKKYFRAARRSTTKRLNVMCLPDSTNIYNTDTQELIKYFFSGLHNLHKLVWLAENLTLDHLQVLPHRGLVEHLDVTLSFANHFTFDDKLQSTVFKNLRHLHLRPFTNSERLQNLLAAVLGEEITTDLDSLELARFESDSPALIPARELSNLGTETPPNEDPSSSSTELETKILRVLLESRFVVTMKNLSELCLNSVLVSEKDAQLLVNSVELSNLKKLSLKNVAEYGNDGHEHHTQGFLGQISTRLADLEHLHLDFRETSRDTIASFLAKIPRLKSLDLVVRMNVFKRRNVDEPELYHQYGVAIAGHNTLEKLSMEVRQEHSFCEIVMPTPKAMLSALIALHKLTSLRIPSAEGHAYETLTAALQNLKDLQIIDVYGVKTGGYPNLGLGMVHPNIYDEWFKVQPFAENYYEIQPHIQYVRINDCVFECEFGKVQPRDTIDRWFDEKVHVS